MRSKFYKKYIIFLFVGLIVSLLLNACALTFAPVSPAEARLEANTNMTERLHRLPEPQEKIVVTVYKFRDQTGQYKSSETGSNWSTAVTQGATTILLKALEESNWFIVIEREGLSNLLNERKIIRSSRANFQSNNDTETQLLPPLLFAGVILEGGIISYDSNIRTGGVGIKYFGAGGSNQYREDRISVYLRAVSSQSGRILLTVNTTKTILSQLVDVGFFRYVKFKKLLEAETGYSYNEPAQICVKEAIEKAVESLIIEGVLKNIWNLQSDDDLNSTAIKNYIIESNNNKTKDAYNRELTSLKSFGAGFNFGMQSYVGDFNKSEFTNAGRFNFKIAINDYLDLGLNIGKGQLSDGNLFEAENTDILFLLNYNLLPGYKLNTYISMGAGFTASKLSENYRRVSVSDSKIKWYPQLTVGLGFEYRLFDRFGLNLLFDNHYYLEDKIDNLDRGYYNDYYWGSRIGFMFYF